ncbi:MAG: DUF4404 family protein [Arenicellaceae bacterium]|nr:DUF4404 family protein [Arenicellaceae bacterium]
MSSKELHDLLDQLKLERENSDMVDGEYQSRLDEIIESLETQKLYPDAFDQYSTLSGQVKELFGELEAEHPSIHAVLDGIHEVLLNFRAQLCIEPEYI